MKAAGHECHPLSHQLCLQNMLMVQWVVVKNLTLSLMCHKKNCLQQPALLLEPVTEKLLKRLFYHAISRLTQPVLLVGLVSAGFFYHDHLRHSMKKVIAAGILFFFKENVT
jgi:hypothetical protein